jgi:phosphatidate cytidylyltransferase
MSDTRVTFIQRVISGLLGAGIVFSLSYFGGTPGVTLVITLATLLAVREYSRMLWLHWPIPAAITYSYWLISALLYIFLYKFFAFAALWFACAAVLQLVAGLWLGRGKLTNDHLLSALALGDFGLVYCVLFPAFALQMALLENGVQWFFFLLILVFFGDTFAYFGGRWFGRKKLMPDVSPNKTWAGAIAGLLGSGAAGTIFLASILQHLPWLQTFLFCLFCGVVAQSGDLLMSLVKRVAQVKDSGHIMPGHGGILDRLDGIFISCPLVYGFALYIHSVLKIV